MIITVNQTHPHPVDGAPAPTTPSRAGSPIAAMAGPVSARPDAAGRLDAVRLRIGHWLRVDAARLLWPSRCLVCDAPGVEGLDLCAACYGDLPWNHRACPGCAIPMAEAGMCGECHRADAVLGRRGRKPPLDYVHAGLVYAPPIDRLLPRFKFHRDLAAGAMLAQLMAEAAAALPRPDALVPVPLHRARLRRRGYDQAMELARPLARALALPLRDDLLQRIRATAPQSELSAPDRSRNVRRAFHADENRSLPDHIVLIDDVMTTGATLRAAARALKRAGVKRVGAWVCARVP